MIIPESAWDQYIEALAKIDRVATERMQKYIDTHAIDDEDTIREMVDYAYGISTYYGEAAAELAAEMYDALSGDYDPAEPAETSPWWYVDVAVRGALKAAPFGILVAGAVGRTVKLAGQNTVLINAIRDGAEVAWIPRGDTCPFCIMLAGEGWKKAYPSMLKDGNAKHIHGNCDCAYAIRHNPDTEYAGYNPSRYQRMYAGADGVTEKDKLNAMRREFYEQNKERINEQKRTAYARRKALEASSAEETDVNG